MKYLFLSLLLLTGFVSVKGQMPMTTTTGTTSGGYTISSVPRGSPGKPVYDTIPVIMLVTLDRELDTVTRTAIFIIPYAYMLKGYEVMEKRDHDAENFVYLGPRFYLQFVTYLDANKNPLPKNIIVWQTK